MKSQEIRVVRNMLRLVQVASRVGRIRTRQSTPDTRLILPARLTGLRQARRAYQNSR